MPSSLGQLSLPPPKVSPRAKPDGVRAPSLGFQCLASAPAVPQLGTASCPRLCPSEPSGFRRTCLAFNSDFLSLPLHARHCAGISSSTAPLSGSVCSLWWRAADEPRTPTSGPSALEESGKLQGQQGGLCGEIKPAFPPGDASRGEAISRGQASLQSGHTLL